MFSFIKKFIIIFIEKSFKISSKINSIKIYVITEITIIIKFLFISEFTFLMLSNAFDIFVFSSSLSSSFGSFNSAFSSLILGTN